MSRQPETYEELGGEEQQKLLTHARYLLKHHYIDRPEYEEDDIAREIFHRRRQAAMRDRNHE